MTALFVIGAILIIAILQMAAGASAGQPAPRHPVQRRGIPLDPVIDAGLDPLIAPWAEVPPLRHSSDELVIADDEPFTPGGGDFGGGGASGNWNEGGDPGDDGGGSSDDD